MENSRRAGGDTTAQFNLGWLYANGKGVPQDHITAAKWYMLAAVHGNVLAQYNLGVMYKIGMGVTQDHKTAVEWFRLSAEQGLIDAQFILGGMYANRKGVVRDNIYAHMWYSIAALSGYEDAAHSKEIVAKSNVLFSNRKSRETCPRLYKNELQRVLSHRKYCHH